MKKIACILLFIAQFQTYAQICFASPKQWSVGSSTGPLSIASADFNGDGSPDIVTPDFTNGNVSVLLSMGGFPAPQLFPVGAQPAAVVCADFDGDAIVDLVVANSGSNNLSILKGDGIGGFTAIGTAAVGNTPKWLTVGDFDGDTKMDVAVSNNNSITISVLLGNGTGGFLTTVTYTVTGQPSGIENADFNLDGNKDLAVGVGTGICILLGTGTGTFGPATAFAGLGWEVAVADFNTDGKPDLAGSSKTGSGIDVYLGDGLGAFSAPTSFTTAANAKSITAADFNNDGKQDLSVTHECPTNVLTILLGDGLGGFVTGNVISGPFVCLRKSIAVDIDSDGKKDIAMADQNGNQIITILQDSPPVISATATPTIVCSGLTTTLNGTGPGSVTYTWSHGVSDGVAFTPTATANYTVTGSAGPGCNSSDTITVVVLPSPTVTANASSTLLCPGTQLTLTGGGADTYTWTGGITNGVAFTPTVTAGYTVTGTALNNCVNSATVSVAIKGAPLAPEICEVTVDSLSINNIIYWDKTLYPKADSFYIYRDTANYNYVMVGAVPYSALSSFIDTARHICLTVNGDPQATYYKYKLSYKDSCGAFSPLSLYHQSVFMYNTGGLFQWNHYEIEGQPVPVPGLTQYKLMRDNIANGNYVLAAGASASSTLVSDPNYTTYQTTADWRIETQWNIACTPTMFMGNNGTQGTIVKSRSNVKTNRTTGIKVQEINFSIFPNPANENFTIETNAGAKKTVRVFNMTGDVVLIQDIFGTTQINTSSFNAGVYYVSIDTTKSSTKKKLIIVR